MLLIGSRAIVHHLPDFRPPRDWDLVGSDEEIARLGRVLLPDPRHRSRPDKAYFRHAGALVEVASTDAVPYWAKVARAFADAEVIREPLLGELRVPHPGFLLITKQCGLIYRIAHWHKNLEDLCFMRDRIATIPEEVAALLPDAVADSRRMFGEGHASGPSDADPCHPDLAGPQDPALHRALHLEISAAPLAFEPGAWRGFPALPGEARRARMIDLFAEEAMVMAAEQGRRTPEASRHKLLRWALRTLITGKLPEGLRYFGVNYYREIMDRVGDPIA